MSDSSSPEKPENLPVTTAYPAIHELGVTQPQGLAWLLSFHSEHCRTMVLSQGQVGEDGGRNLLRGHVRGTRASRDSLWWNFSVHQGLATVCRQRHPRASSSQGAYADGAEKLMALWG